MAASGFPPQAMAEEHLGRFTSYILLCLAMDALLLSAALGLSIVLHAEFSRWIASLYPIHALAWSKPNAFYVLGLAIILSTFVYEGIYRHGLPALDRTEALTRGLSLSFFFLISISFIVHQSDAISRFLIFITYFVSLILLVLCRPHLENYIARMTDIHPSVHIYSPNSMNADSLHVLRAQGFRFETARRSHEQEHAGAALVAMDSPECQLNLTRLELAHSEVGILPPLDRITPMGARPLNIRGGQIFVITHPLNKRCNRWLKRGTDMALSGLLLITLSPIIFTIMAALWLQSRGSAFYRQRRLGWHHRPFHIWKFRTMMDGADGKLVELLQRDPLLSDEFRKTWKLKNDPRVTPLGKWLRKTSLDELPQLWNVLRGDMSLVGPRAIVESELQVYGQAHEIIKTVRPGMTGIWQTSGRSDASYASRRDFDLYYVRNWSLWLDISLLIKTLQVVTLPGGY